ncbi:MAG: hypothetical protein GDA36_04520 [Rhodobacteraceae bacterium]|nr:hypothetical protein [Paracoccaceae bacterium]
MFGGSVNWAILSDPLALQRAKQLARRFWWSGYAIAGVYGLKMILFAALASSARLPPSPVGRFVLASLASPNYRARCRPKKMRHRGIGSAQSLKQRLELSLPLALFPSPQGSMTGGYSHDSVTVATTQGIPVGLAGIGPVGQYTRPPVRPFDHDIEPRGSRPGSQVPHVDLVDEAFLVRDSPGRAKPPGCHLRNPAVCFAPFLTRRACVSAPKCTPGSSGTSASARFCGASI